MIQVSQESGDIIIRFSAEAVEPDTLIRLLDLLNHEIRRPNSVTLASSVPPQPANPATRRRKRTKKKVPLDQLELPFARVS